MTPTSAPVAIGFQRSKIKYRSDLEIDGAEFEFFEIGSEFFPHLIAKIRIAMSAPNVMRSDPE
jgi:hypothetical protein